MPNWTPSDYQAFLARRVSRSTAPDCAQYPAAVPSATEIIECATTEFQATLDKLKAAGRYAQVIDVLPGARYRLTVRPKPQSLRV